MTSGEAIHIRQMRRTRVRMIRGRVIGYSVALFVALWALIAVLLVTGHDPVLSRHASASASTGSSVSSAGSGAGATTSGIGSEDSESSDGFGDSGSSSSAGSSSAGSSTSTGGGLVSPSPVTSGQS